MNNTSSPNETFGPNLFRAVFLIVAALAGYYFGRDLSPSRAAVPFWVVSATKVALVATPVLLLCWLLSVRLAIDGSGVRYRSLLRRYEVQWAEVDELYAGATTTLLYGLIPFGTRYRFMLRSGLAEEERVEQTRKVGMISVTRTSVKRGTAARVLSFGSRFYHAAKIGSLLNEFAFPILWRKATERYNAGLDVSFGDFRISKNGITADLLGLFPNRMNKPIPWSDVRAYSVENGDFRLVYGSGSKTFAEKRNVSEIANFRVMMALLQHLQPQ